MTTPNIPCAQPAQTNGDYLPLSRAEIEALTCMQAGAPWAEPALTAVAELIAIYDWLRAQGKRPIDPADMTEAEQDAYWKVWGVKLEGKEGRQ